MVLIAIIAAVAGAKKTVRLNDYFKVSFEGVETKGYATVDSKYTALYNALTDAGGKKILKSSSIYTPQDTIIDSIEVTVSPNEELSNGDEVTVHYSFSSAIAKQYGVKLKAKDEKIKVSGLKEVEEVNPFDYITLKYEGVSGNIYASVEVDDSKIDYLDEIYFDIDDNYDLSVGDTVTVSMESYYADAALEHGYKFTETKHTYTIDSADSYLESLSQIDNDTLAKMQAEAEDEIRADLAGEDYTVSDQRYIGAYFNKIKTESSYYYDNYVYLVYTANATQEDGDYTNLPVYMVVQFSDNIVSADGSLAFDDDPAFYYSYSYVDGTWDYVEGYTDPTEMYSDIITSNSGDYNHEVIGEELKAFGE